MALAKPMVGLGFRLPIASWIFENLHHFDVLEITVDHYIYSGDRGRAVMRDLVGAIPMVAHGVGLSIGTDVPLDPVYLDKVAEAMDALQMKSYSEHLAWTKVPGIDLANLLPLPRNRQAVESVIGKVVQIQSHLNAPFALENISYVFEFPDADMSEAEIFKLIHAETGATVLLDVENLFVNSENHHFDATEFMDALPRGIVSGIHVAGGPVVSRPYLDAPVWVDTHSAPAPEAALQLLNRALDDHSPQTIVLERDDEVDDVEELMTDIQRIRAYVDAKYDPSNASQ